jgi:hypothetical protein
MAAQVIQFLIDLIQGRVDGAGIGAEHQFDG